MLPSPLRHTGQPSPPRTTWPKVAAVVRFRNLGLPERLSFSWGLLAWEHSAPGRMDLVLLVRPALGQPAEQQPQPGSSTAGVLTPALRPQAGRPRNSSCSERSSANRELASVTRLSCGRNANKKVHKKKAGVWIHRRTRWQCDGAPVCGTPPQPWLKNEWRVVFLGRARWWGWSVRWRARGPGNVQGLTEARASEPGSRAPLLLSRERPPQAFPLSRAVSEGPAPLLTLGAKRARPGSAVPPKATGTPVLPAPGRGPAPRPGDGGGLAGPGVGNGASGVADRWGQRGWRPPRSPGGAAS